MSRSVRSARSSPYNIAGALEALLAQRRSAEQAKRVSFAQAQARLEQAERRLAGLENAFARACRELERGGAASAASLENATAAARSAVIRLRNETVERRDEALAAIRDREAAQALNARRMDERAAREVRKEERELEEANQG